MNLIKIAIVEDDLLYLEQLLDQLKELPWLSIKGVYHTQKDAIEGLQQNDPEVVFLDLDLPDGSGINILKQMKHSSDDLPCFIILTVFSDDQHLFDALKAGATGYLLKDETSPAELEKLINDVLKGGSPVSPSIARKIIEEFRKKPVITSNVSNKLQKLTKRESEILNYLNQGYSAKEISNKANISYHTVREHLKNIYKKLQVNSGLEAVAVLKEVR